jgi:hypothetical protein
VILHKGGVMDNVFIEAGQVQTGGKKRGLLSIVNYNLKEEVSPQTAELFIDTGKALLPVKISSVGFWMELDDQIKVPEHQILKLFKKE